MNFSKKRLPRIFLILGICVAALFFVFLLLKFLPNKALSSFIEKQYSSRIFDSNGELLYVLPLEEGLRREYRSLNEIPKELYEKMIQEEDKNFFRHPGVDFAAVLRAAKQNRESGRVVSGASTITMQLVRLVWKRKGQVNAGTKILESFRAFYLEIKFSKKEILELYLNNVPFGFQIEGVASAARSFFCKVPLELSSEEMEVLSKIPRRPADYAPLKKYSYPQKCRHYVSYVLSDFKQKKKIIPNEVHLSLDGKLNALLESQIQMRIDEHSDARIHNGSAFIINNRTGEIVSWIGNADFDSQYSGQIDGVIVQNQPGSSMKPFLYALALERGIPASTVLPDIQMDFGAAGVYVPLNFNNRFNGPVRLRVALASSLNVPAVYLLQEIGMKEYLSVLDKLGFESLRENYVSQGLSLALGSAEVSLYEMVRAFSVFPNEGEVFEELKFFLPSKKEKPKMRRVYSKDTARMMLDILSDSHARELGFARAKVFVTPYPSIFKTGTSNQFQNIIALGATSEYTCGVWMGNFEGETVVRETGSSIPARVVRTALDYLSEKKEPEKFSIPEHYEKKEVCALSGMKPTSSCPTTVKEFVRKGISSDSALVPCTWHSVEGGKVHVHYPSEYQHWASGKNMSGGIQNALGEKLRIVYPRRDSVFLYDPSVPKASQMMQVRAVGGSANTAELYVDALSYGKRIVPFAWEIPLLRGNHTLEILCGDERVSQSYVVK